MKYLILRGFRSYGVMLHKGEVVDEAAIRSPRLRCSEGKIIPAVSSSAAPEETAVAAPPSSGVATNEDSTSQTNVETVAAEPAKSGLKLSFNK